MKKVIAIVLVMLQLSSIAAFGAHAFPPQRPDVGVMMVESDGWGGDLVVALRTDGTINVKGNDHPIALEKFTDIVDVEVVWGNVVGLKADGTIVLDSSNIMGGHFWDADLSAAETWTDIVAIEGGRAHLVGLKADGTVVATGDNEQNQCSVAGWENIVKIYAEYEVTLAITKDGQVRAIGMLDNDVDYYSLQNVAYLIPIDEGVNGITTYCPVFEDGTSLYDLQRGKVVTTRENENVMLLAVLKENGITETIVQMTIAVPSFGGNLQSVYALTENGNFYEIDINITMYGYNIKEIKKLPVKIVQYKYDGCVEAGAYHAVAENGRIYSNNARYDSADWVLTTNITIDGVAVTTDVAPYIKDGRTLAPMRAILEALGMSVTWDDATQRATAVKGDVTIVVGINDNIAYVNGEAKVLDVPAELTRGRTFVPVRFFAEALGLDVSWDSYTQTVVIKTK